MALYSNPPHRVTTYSSASNRDTGGGVELAYTAVQSDVPCSINTADASTIERFAKMDILVTHTVGFLSSALTTPLTPGMKLVAADTSASFQIQGISTGRQYGSIPPFTYAHCQELL